MPKTIIKFGEPVFMEANDGTLYEVRLRPSSEKPSGYKEIVFRTPNASYPWGACISTQYGFNTTGKYKTDYRIPDEDVMFWVDINEIN